MNRLSSYEQELSLMEQGAKITDMEPKELVPSKVDTYCISPGTWVEDPITGERECIKYWYKTSSQVCCPHCEENLPAATFIKTKKHIILYCDSCYHYTWFRVVRP